MDRGYEKYPQHFTGVVAKLFCEYGDFIKWDLENEKKICSTTTILFR